MASVYTFNSGVESLLALPAILISEGAKVSPRDQLTYEMRNVLIEITDSTDVTMMGIGRNWNPKIAVAEALQLIGGFSDAERMRDIVPGFKRFMNGGSLHGAYGPRVSMQMSAAIRRLIDDPDTRQSVVTIWDPLHDLMQEGRKDLPCTLSFTFSVRDDKLNMSTHMRSNDLWWGWSYDLFQFTQLQWTVANFLGIDAGSYTHYADSFHLYDRDADMAAALTQPTEAARPLLSGIGRFPQEKTWQEVQWVAQEVFYDRNNDDMTSTEDWMDTVMRSA